VSDVCFFREADCDTDHYRLQKLWERLSVSKQAMQKFDMGKFNLKKLNDIEVKEQYQVKIFSRFAVLESLNDNVDFNCACEKYYSIKT
jgi:hypothetical protein